MCASVCWSESLCDACWSFLRNSDRRKKMTKAISNGIGILLRYLVKEVSNKKLNIKQESEEETEKERK